MQTTSSSGAAVSRLTVDANVLISALRQGAAMRVLAFPRLTFCTTVRTTWEVERYIPELAALLTGRGAPVTELKLLERFRSLRLIAAQDSVYRGKIPLARKLIAKRDPRDVDILALTLRLGVPIWTHDRDFEGIPQIRVVTTAELLTLIEG